jgi:mono/diheme cytochrome c family protein
MRINSSLVCCALLFLTQACAASGDTDAASAPTGDAERGKELFHSDLGCNICHGADASGSVGPDIRQTTIENVYHALQNFPDMMNWQFNNPELFEDQSLLDIVAYLQTLEKEDAE